MPPLIGNSSLFTETTTLSVGCGFCITLLVFQLIEVLQVLLNPNPNFLGPFSGYVINEKHADKILDDAYFKIFTIVEK